MMESACVQSAPTVVAPVGGGEERNNNNNNNVVVNNVVNVNNPTLGFVASDDRMASDADLFCFVGSFQPYMDPPEPENSLSSRTVANDNDNDGIWVLEQLVLPPGLYDVTVVSLFSSEHDDELYEEQVGGHGEGSDGGGGNNHRHRRRRGVGVDRSRVTTTREFEVGVGDSRVTVFFHRGEKVVDVSVNTLPIIIGDFMAAAGHYPSSPPTAVYEANWNVHNMFGWLKDSGGGKKRVYTTNLHVPVGRWEYKLCFRGRAAAVEDADDCIGKDGSSHLPFSIDVVNVGGESVTFSYDPATQAVSAKLDSMEATSGDSDVGQQLGVRPEAMHAATSGVGGARSLLAREPVDSSGMGSWVGRVISFNGNFGPFMSPPVGALDARAVLGADVDGDGIVEHQFLVSAGSFFYLCIDLATFSPYDAFGVSKPFDLADFALPEFTVPETPGSEFMNVTLYFDWRDRITTSSLHVMPVVCGDFMADAGYFGPAVGAEGANWNPDNLLGWMKDYDGSGIYQVFLNIPPGLWKYKICFRGEAVGESLGVGGSQFPHLLHVTNTGGSSVGFMYDMATHTVMDSLGGTAPLMLPEPMLLVSPLGAAAITPSPSSGMGSWVGRVISFNGNFGPFMSPPVGALDARAVLGADVDGDGIVEHQFLVSAGSFFYLCIDLATFSPYDAFGVSKPFDLADFALPEFTVPETPGSEFMNVTLYFDWRDRITTSSLHVVPVVCGDFMADAGYFGPAVGAGGANWNPDNLLGWMKSYDRSSVYQIFLHIPQGMWKYKICFRGEDVGKSVGLGGSQFPHLLNVEHSAGADITIMYNMATHTVMDSLGGTAPLMLPEPMLVSPLGAAAITPSPSSGMGSWVGRVISFNGNFGPFMSPPVGALDARAVLGADVDGDGIVEHQFLVSAGSFFYLCIDLATFSPYDAFGVSKPFDLADFALPEFTVPETPGSEFMNVTLYFDWRDRITTSSLHVMPVVCGDFMADAGYFGPAVGAEGANWNPDNLLGWMKSYDRSSVYQIFLHIPQGMWKYKICFRGEDVGKSVGLGGSQFPHLLNVEHSAGADITIMYNMATHTVMDSLGGTAPLMLPEPMLVSPLGAAAITPSPSSGMGSWVGRVISFNGNFGPFMSPPVGALDARAVLGADVDGDGIVEHQFLVSAGSFFYLCIDLATFSPYDAFGVSKPFDLADFALPEFTVPETPGSDFMNVTLYFDWRDRITTSSLHVMPVVCGDFMADAGYFGPAVGAGGANWNPDNLVGWMKAYDGSGVSLAFLHVPEGEWRYRVCFRGVSLDQENVGFGGKSDVPITLRVPAGGSDVTFMFDSDRGVASDSINGLPPLDGCSLECGAHGECSENRCECDAGYAGPVCEYVTHFNVSSGADPGTCMEGWTGVQCTLADHCRLRDERRRCVGGCEQGWAGQNCTQIPPLGGGSGSGLDLGDRIYPWAMPPVGARDKPVWRGGLAGEIEQLQSDWKCSKGSTPFSHLRTMETWVYLHPYDPRYGSAVMPLLSTGAYQWGLHFVAPGVFRQHLVFGAARVFVSRLVNTQTGTALREGAFPLHEGEVNTWVHVAMVATPDEADGDNLELTSYINGEYQFSSKSGLHDMAEAGILDYVRIGNFHVFHVSSETDHQQWARPHLDEFRLWTKPQSGLAIRDRLHRPLTPAELAWPDELEFPDCFLYLPFRPENLDSRSSAATIGTGVQGGFYFPFVSTARTGPGAEEAFRLKRSGNERTITDSRGLATDIGALVPSSAPVGGEEHIVVGHAGVPTTFTFPVMVASHTAEDALIYPRLRPLRAKEGGDVNITVTSVRWKRKLLYRTLGMQFAEETFTGSIVLEPDGSVVGVGMEFGATSSVTVTMVAGDWSNVVAPSRYTRERIMPVLEIGYRCTVRGLVSPDAVVHLKILPPSSPVAGGSGKALRCNGAGPLGTAHDISAKEWGQWAAADVLFDVSDTAPFGSEGFTAELWFLAENLEGPEDIGRIFSRLIFGLGGGSEETTLLKSSVVPGISGTLGVQMGPDTQQNSALSLRYHFMRSWSHLAVHVYPGLNVPVTAFFNGQLWPLSREFNILPLRQRGFFVCGRPGWAAGEDGGFEGAIDEVRLWRGPRSEQQIRDWMFRRLDRHQLPVSEQARLVAHWDFEDDGITADGRVVDRSGNNQDLVPGGCHVPVDGHPNPPECGGRRDVTPDPHRIPTTFLPQPESPVAGGGGEMEVEVEMGELPVFTLEGYEPEVMRCPHTPITECRKQSDGQLPHFHLGAYPPPSGVGGAAMFVVGRAGGGGGDGEGEGEGEGEDVGVRIEDAENWSSVTNDEVGVQPLDPLAGGHPFATVSYYLVSPVAGRRSDTKVVLINIRCAPGHYLDQAARLCAACPPRSYRQFASFEDGCCDLAAPGDGCFQCPPGFMMVESEEVEGTAACVLPPCGKYDTKVLLENGLQECVPSFDLPPGARVVLEGVTACVMLVVLAGLAVIYRFRRSRVVINSSRPFMVLMLLGLGLITASVGLEVQPQTDSLCFWKTISFHVGFSLMFGSAVAKTWRLHKIFNNRRMTRVQVKSSQLYPIVAGFVVVDVLVVVVWTLVAPMEVKNEMQKVCESEHMGMFLPAVIVNKAVLMGVGCWLTYQVRGIPSSFNEATGITLTLNNVTLLGVLELGVATAMGEELEEGGIMKVVMAACGLVGVLLAIGLIFVPKFGNAIHDRKQSSTKTSVGLATSNRKTQYGAGTGPLQNIASPLDQLKKLEGQMIVDGEQVVALRVSSKKMEEQLKKLQKGLMRKQDEIDYLRADPNLKNVKFSREELLKGRKATEIGSTIITGQGTVVTGNAGIAPLPVVVTQEAPRKLEPVKKSANQGSGTVVHVAPKGEAAQAEMKD